MTNAASNNNPPSALNAINPAISASISSATAPVHQDKAEHSSTAKADTNLSLEKVLALEDEITLLLQRKREVERNLAALEVQVHNTETKYLEQTAALGNMAKGFDGYLFSASGHRQTANSNAVNLFGSSSNTSIHDSDRLFSQSSSTYRKALQLVKEIEMGGPLSDYGYTSNGSAVKKKHRGNKAGTTGGRKRVSSSAVDEAETNASSSEY